MTRKHDHYFKPTNGVTHIDVYWVLDAFNVADPTLQHAVKKLLCAGIRGGGKDFEKDVQEAIDTLQRGQEMRAARPLVSNDPDVGKDGAPPVQDNAPEVPLTLPTFPRTPTPISPAKDMFKPPVYPGWPILPIDPATTPTWVQPQWMDPSRPTWSERNPI